MSSEETCNFENATINKIYQNLISEKLVENASTLLNTLPTKNLEQKINEKGLISNTYKIKQKSIYIEMNYEGGVTTILLEQLGNSVKRIITLSAD
jgi:hypothetical protein